MTTDTQSAASISEETLSTLRKLYERSKRSDSHLENESSRQAAEQEAAQAAEMLGRLLDKYGLALADVDSKGHTHQISHGHVRESTIDFGKSNFAWKIDLARAVIRHNNCQILSEIYRKHKIQGFVLVGLELHVQTTMMLLEWLYAQIKDIASADYKQYKTSHWEHIDPLRWHTNFGKGAGQRLASRLQTIRDQEAAEAAARARDVDGVAPEMSLAVNIGTAIRDYLEAKEPWRKEQRLQNEAYQARIQQRSAIMRIQEKAWPVWFAWQTPWIQCVTVAAHMRLEEKANQQLTEWREERSKANAESNRRWQRNEQARQRRRDRFYQEHGYYPEDARRTKADATEWTAYDAGYRRANDINLSPHLNAGEQEAAPAALGR